MWREGRHQLEAVLHGRGDFFQFLKNRIILQNTLEVLILFHIFGSGTKNMAKSAVLSGQRGEKDGSEK